jgi:hypothetical protein
LAVLGVLQQLCASEGAILAGAGLGTEIEQEWAKYSEAKQLLQARRTQRKLRANRRRLWKECKAEKRAMVAACAGLECQATAADVKRKTYEQATRAAVRERLQLQHEIDACRSTPTADSSIGRDTGTIGYAAERTDTRSSRIELEQRLKRAIDGADALQKAAEEGVELAGASSREAMVEAMEAVEVAEGIVGTMLAEDRHTPDPVEGADEAAATRDNFSQKSCKKLPRASTVTIDVGARLRGAVDCAVGRHSDFHSIRVGHEERVRLLMERDQQEQEQWLREQEAVVAEGRALREEIEEEFHRESQRQLQQQLQQQRQQHLEMSVPVVHAHESMGDETIMSAAWLQDQLAAEAEECARIQKRIREVNSTPLAPSFCKEALHAVLSTETIAAGTMVL